MNRILLLLLLTATAQAAPSGYRTALLLGNSQYQGFPLQGVAPSLDAVEQTLKANGFQITRRENLEQKAMKEAVEQFARSAPTNSVAVIYYIGLGAHAERFGKYYNLLRPIKADIKSDNDYRSRAVNVSDLLKTLQTSSGARTHLLFLDACWESPLKPDKAGGGMREMEIETDAMVMFAAASGKTLPPPSQNKPSPLAAALAKRFERFEDSVQAACREIDKQAWFGGDSEQGIGEPSPWPKTETLQDGKTPGEGFVNSVGMGFRWCPAGEFVMGSQDADASSTRDRQPVPVKLSRGFWMGEHEVTQREYNVVRRKNPPLGFTLHKNAPFWGASDSKGVDDFCKQLTSLERKAGKLPQGWVYACPTEAEWEYACRGGSDSAFCFGDSAAELGQYGNFADRALLTENPNFHWADKRADDGVGESLALVGGYRPNAWGLRDMHGNVAEIVADHLTLERPGGVDPLVRVEKEGVLQIRGGAWCSTPLYCQSTFRNAAPGRDKHNFIGFRVVLKQEK